MADGYFLVGMGSNQEGDISPPTERVGTRASITTRPVNSSNTIFQKASRKPEDKDKGSEKNKQFDPGGKGEKPPPWNAAVVVLFSFRGELWAMGGSPFVLRVLCLCMPVCLFIIYCSISEHVQRAEKHEKRRGSSR